MALAVPNNRFPAKGKEAALFNYLTAQLPNDYTIWSQPELATPEYLHPRDERASVRPDLIVFSPNAGLLTLEVKDWFTMSQFKADTVTINKYDRFGNRRDGLTINPFRQAREYAACVEEHLKNNVVYKHPQIDPGLRSAPILDDMPRGRAVLFTNITRADFRNSGWRQNLWRDHALFADELFHEGQNLMPIATLSAFFRAWMGPRQSPYELLAPEGRLMLRPEERHRIIPVWGRSRAQPEAATDPVPPELTRPFNDRDLVDTGTAKAPRSLTRRLVWVAGGTAGVLYVASRLAGDDAVKSTAPSHPSQNPVAPPPVPAHPAADFEVDVSGEAPLFDQPSAGSEQIAALPNHTRLRVLEESANNWRKVEAEITRNGKPTVTTGYVRGYFTRPLTP